MSYDYDIEVFRSVLLGAVSKLAYLMDGKPIEFFSREFSDPGIKTMVRFWFVPGPELDSNRATSEAIDLIYRDLKSAGIKLPATAIILTNTGK